MVKSQRMWRREQERRRRERLKRERQRRMCAAVVVLAAVGVTAIAVSRSCTGDEIGTSMPATQTESVSPSPVVGRTAAHGAEDISMEFFDDSVFLGNAVADGINMYGLLPQSSFYTSVVLDLDNVYTTVAGSGTVSAADSLKSTKFNKIFLSFGSREMENGNSLDFFNKYTELVAKVREYQPNAQIYVIAIPPSSAAVSAAGQYGASAANIAEFNSRIERLAQDNKLFYVDSVRALANSNYCLPDGVSADGINLDRDCYIDLLYYITQNAYVPDGTNTQNNVPGIAPANAGYAQTSTAPSAENTQSSTGTASETSPTAAPSPTATATAAVSEQSGTSPTPAPTVNVLKSSASSDSR